MHEWYDSACVCAVCVYVYVCDIMCVYVCVCVCVCVREREREREKERESLEYTVFIRSFPTDLVNSSLVPRPPPCLQYGKVKRA